MLTDLQRDILIKSAEGIQEGMWCTGHKFRSQPTTGMPLLLGNSYNFTIEDALLTQRCALGEIELRTVQAGGNRWDHGDILDAVSQAIASGCNKGHDSPKPQDVKEAETVIIGHNDGCLGDLHSFDAGQEWARIFREVAEA